MMASSTKGASYCCFRKAVSDNYFHKVLLINFTSIYRNLLTHFIFAPFLLIGDDEQGDARKELIISSFIEWFKTANLRKSY